METGRRLECVLHCAKPESTAAVTNIEVLLLFCVGEKEREGEHDREKALLFVSWFRPFQPRKLFRVLPIFLGFTLVISRRRRVDDDRGIL